MSVKLQAAQRITSVQVPELARATWSNAWKIGDEVVLSGMTAHPASQLALAQGAELGACPNPGGASKAGGPGRGGWRQQTKPD
jgi:hypothetical protein